jgi:hypothetical protein
MRTVGKALCDLLSRPLPNPIDQALILTYYDAEKVMYQAGEYTGDAAFLACAQRAELIYRDNYVVPAGGQAAGYWVFTNGLRWDFERTADVKSRDAVLSLATKGSFCVDGTDVDSTVHPALSREVAYCGIAMLDAETLGAAPRPRLQLLVDQALHHIDLWVTEQAFATAGGDVPAAVGFHYFQPFMGGITARFLIAYNAAHPDPRILPAIKKLADYTWAQSWVAVNESFWYDAYRKNGVWNNPNGDGLPGAPDLNLLIATMYEWVYQQTRDASYRTKGDAIFAGGVKLAWLDGGKQFNQNYTWSFDFVKSRKGQ